MSLSIEKQDILDGASRIVIADPAMHDHRLDQYIKGMQAKITTLPESIDRSEKYLENTSALGRLAREVTFQVTKMINDPEQIAEAMSTLADVANNIDPSLASDVALATQIREVIASRAQKLRIAYERFCQSQA